MPLSTSVLLSNGIIYNLHNKFMMVCSPDHFDLSIFSCFHPPQHCLNDDTGNLCTQTPLILWLCSTNDAVTELPNSHMGHQIHVFLIDG